MSIDIKNIVQQTIDQINLVDSSSPTELLKDLFVTAYRFGDGAVSSVDYIYELPPVDTTEQNIFYVNNKTTSLSPGTYTGGNLFFKTNSGWKEMLGTYNEVKTDQGEVAAYTWGGYTPNSPGYSSGNQGSKIFFASDVSVANATIYIPTSVSPLGTTSQIDHLWNFESTNSYTHAFHYGGLVTRPLPAFPEPPNHPLATPRIGTVPFPLGALNFIRKYSFASDAVEEAFYEQQTIKSICAIGLTDAENQKGYFSGMENYGTNDTNTVRRLSYIPFSTVTGVASNSTLTHGRNPSATTNVKAGFTSNVDGYTWQSPTTMEKFPFSSASPSIASILVTYTGHPGDPSDYMADLIDYRSIGHQSKTHGYLSGGQIDNPLAPNVWSKQIMKFPFAQPWSSYALVGELSSGRLQGTGSSSKTHGYNIGGRGPNNAGPPTNPIPYIGTADKFSLASDTPGVGIASLINPSSNVSNSFGAGGHQ